MKRFQSNWNRCGSMKTAAEGTVDMNVKRYPQRAHKEQLKLKTYVPTKVTFYHCVCRDKIEPIH